MSESATGCPTVALRVQEETLVLHPERAVHWVERQTLIVADTHFGKSALLRRHGVAVPAGSDDHDRRRLNDLVRRTAARRLIILGDFLHAPLDPDSTDAHELEEWSAALRSTQIHVVAGNHDRAAPQRWLPPVHWHAAQLYDPPFRFVHDADGGSAKRGCDESAAWFNLSGHIHPVLRLRGLRKRAARVPIFWHRADGLVLPSFGIFTGGYVVRVSAGERVFAAGPERVVPFRVLPSVGRS